MCKRSRDRLRERRKDRVCVCVREAEGYIERNSVIFREKERERVCVCA